MAQVMEKAKSKTTDPQEVTERIVYWESNNTGVTIEAFLGWTSEEYIKYAQEGVIPSNNDLKKIND